jgi:sulfite exporter TauE/SafE
MIALGKTSASPALWPYHLGRIITYATIGTAGAVLSSHLVSFAGFKFFSAILLVIAGFLFLLTAFQSILPKACGLPAWVTKSFSALLYKDIPGKVFITGLLLGFIPCGLVYAALLAVTATSDPILALGGMIAFGIGTIPALLAVHIGCRKIKPQFATPSSYAFKFLSIVNAFILFVMAGEQIT